jgi:hypothetical protein
MRKGLMMQTLNIELLPDNARNELLDFYEFLLGKYVETIPKPVDIKQDGFVVPRRVKPFEPLSRDDCHER